MSANAILCCLSVNYASGCSIAKFPEDGIVIAQTFKDQGMHFLLFSLCFKLYFVVESKVTKSKGVRTVE